MKAQLKQKCKYCDEDELVTRRGKIVNSYQPCQKCEKPLFIPSSYRYQDIDQIKCRACDSLNVIVPYQRWHCKNCNKTFLT